MKTILIFLCGVGLTIFVLDYTKVRNKLDRVYEVAYNADKCLYGDGNGLVWEKFRLEDRVEELEFQLFGKKEGIQFDSCIMNDIFNIQKRLDTLETNDN